MYWSLDKRRGESQQAGEEELWEFSRHEEKKREGDESKRREKTREERSDEELGEEHVEIGEHVHHPDLRWRDVELFLKKNNLMKNETKQVL